MGINCIGRNTNGVPAMMEPDSGAYATIIDEHKDPALKKHNPEIQNLRTPTMAV